MESDGDLPQQEGLVMGLGISMEERQNEAFDVKRDRVDPFDSVAVYRRAEAHLAHRLVCSTRLKLAPPLRLKSLAEVRAGFSGTH